MLVRKHETKPTTMSPECQLGRKPLAFLKTNQQRELVEESCCQS